MDCYFDVTVAEQDEMPAHVVLSAVYNQLHFLLVERAVGDIAICFPKAGKGLGTVLRLMGSQTALEQVIANPRWQRLRDYLRISAIRPVPSDCAWYRVMRKQPKLSAAKVRRMLVRGTVLAEEAEALLATPAVLQEPFLHLQSASNGQLFRLFVSQLPTDKPSAPQQFNTYGLGGVVPWF